MKIHERERLVNEARRKVIDALDGLTYGEAVRVLAAELASLAKYKLLEYERLKLALTEATLEVNDDVANRSGDAQIEAEEAELALDAFVYRLLASEGVEEREAPWVEALREAVKAGRDGVSHETYLAAMNAVRRYERTPPSHPAPEPERCPRCRGTEAT